MKGTLTQGGATGDATLQGIKQAVAGGQFFWLNLDIHDPGPDDDVTGRLVNTFHFHPVAAEAVVLLLFKRRGWLGSGPTA